MENGFFLITGTSKGIGEALAKRILEEGNIVLGISRNRSDTLKSTKYHHLSFDLTTLSRINQIMRKVDEIVDNHSFDSICLVNNAFTVEPINSIDKCTETRIESHFKIGLIAPIILTSLFVQKFSGSKMQKKLVFISSGAAFTAVPGLSMYCSSKAAINMFAQCVGLEQKNKEYGFEVIAIGPGMVETSMQQILRSKTDEEFSMAGFFRQAFEAGKIKSPDLIATKILAILENHYDQGQYVNISDV
jgi:benzil reductase ((S)-benzoin forming)